MPGIEEVFLKILEGLSSGAVKGQEAAHKLKLIEQELALKQEAAGLDRQRLDLQGRTPASQGFQSFVEGQTRQPVPEGFEGPEAPGFIPETLEEGSKVLDFTGKKQKQDTAYTTIYADVATGDWDYKPGSDKTPINIPSGVLFKELAGRNKNTLTVDFDESGNPFFKVKSGPVDTKTAGVIQRQEDQGLRKNELSIRDRALKAREKLQTLKTPEGISLMQQLKTKSDLRGVAKEGSPTAIRLDKELQDLIDKANALGVNESGTEDFSEEQKELEALRKSRGRSR